MANLSNQNGLGVPVKGGIYRGDVPGGTCAFGAIRAALYRLREPAGASTAVPHPPAVFGTIDDGGGTATRSQFDLPDGRQCRRRTRPGARLRADRAGILSRVLE